MSKLTRLQLSTCKTAYSKSVLGEKYLSERSHSLLMVRPAVNESLSDAGIADRHIMFMSGHQDMQTYRQKIHQMLLQKGALQ